MNTCRPAVGKIQYSHSYSQGLTGDRSFLATCEGDKCLPRASSAFTVAVCCTPVRMAAGGGAEALEAAGGGAEALEAAGGGAGWRTLVPTAEACLFRTYVLKMAMLVLGLASALTRYLMRAWAFLLWSSYTSFMDRPWKSPNSTIKQPWSPVARASACISCFLSYFSTSSAISLIWEVYCRNSCLFSDRGFFCAVSLDMLSTKYTAYPREFSRSHLNLWPWYFPNWSLQWASTNNWSLGSPPFVLTKEPASASTSSLGLALPDSTVSRRFASADGAMRSRVDVADWRGKTGYAYIFWNENQKETITSSNLKDTCTLSA